MKVTGIVNFASAQQINENVGQMAHNCMVISNRILDTIFRECYDEEMGEKFDTDDSSIGIKYEMDTANTVSADFMNNFEPVKGLFEDMFMSCLTERFGKFYMWNPFCNCKAKLDGYTLSIILAM